MKNELSELINYAFENTSNQLKTVELHFLESDELLFFGE